MRPKSLLPTAIIIFLVHLCSSMAYGEVKFDQQFKTDYGFSVCLTDEWREVPSDILKEMNKKMAELAHAPQNWQYAYQLKKSERWLAYPYILIEFKPGKKSEDRIKKQLGLQDKLQEGLDKASAEASGILSEAKLGKFSHNGTDHSFENLLQFWCYHNIKQASKQLCILYHCNKGVNC